MQKEKKVRAYTRRTKSGKTVTVKAHTAKYDAAEKLKELAKKKGAGNELEEKRKKLLAMEAGKGEDLFKEKPEKEQEEKEQVEKKTPKKEKKEKKPTRPVGAGTTGPTRKDPVKKQKTTSETSGVSKEAFKSWYHFNDWDKPRREWPKEVRETDAALKKQMGKKAYDSFCSDIDNNYSSRGHLSMFKKIGASGSEPSKAKSAKTVSAKEVPSLSDLKKKYGASKSEVTAFLKKKYKGAKVEWDPNFDNGTYHITYPNLPSFMSKNKEVGVPISIAYKEYAEANKKRKSTEDKSENPASSKSIHPKNLTEEQLRDSMKKSGKYTFKKNGEIWYKDKNGRPMFKSSVESYRNLLMSDYKEKSAGNNLKKYAKEYGFSEKDIPALSMLGSKPKRKMSEVSPKAVKNYSRFEDISPRQAKLELMMMSKKEHDSWSTYRESEGVETKKFERPRGYKNQSLSESKKNQVKYKEHYSVMGARRAEKKGIPEETFKKFASFAKGLDSYNVKTYKAVGKFLSSLPPEQRKFFAPKKGEHEAYLRGDLDYNYSNID